MPLAGCISEFSPVMASEIHLDHGACVGWGARALRSRRLVGDFLRREELHCGAVRGGHGDARGQPRARVRWAARRGRAAGVRRAARGRPRALVPRDGPRAALPAGVQLRVHVRREGAGLLWVSARCAARPSWPRVCSVHASRAHGGCGVAGRRRLMRRVRVRAALWRSIRAAPRSSSRGCRRRTASGWAASAPVRTSAPSARRRRRARVRALRARDGAAVRYGVDAVAYVDELAAFVAALGPSAVHVTVRSWALRIVTGVHEPPPRSRPSAGWFEQ